MDIAVLDAIQNYLRSPFLDVVMPFLTHLGDFALIWFVAGAALIATKKRRPYGIAVIVAIVVAAALGTFLLKPFFGRMRPFETYEFLGLLIPAPSGSSFPSNHSMVSFAAAAALCCLPDKTRFANGMKILAVTLACLIAFSRLYLYVHYPSDIFAGALIGVAVGVLSVRLVLYWWERRKPQDPSEPPQS